MFGTLLMMAGAIAADPSGSFTRTAVSKLPTPIVPSSHAIPRSAIPDNVDSAMARWAEASIQQGLPARSGQDALQLAFEKQINRHAADAATGMLGPINIARLKEQYTWKLTTGAGKPLCLEAIPQDDVDRLFFRSIRVWLDSRSQVTQIEVASRDGEQQAHWIAGPAMTDREALSIPPLHDAIAAMPARTAKARVETGVTTVAFVAPRPRQFVQLAAATANDRGADAETIQETTTPSAVVPELTEAAELADILKNWQQASQYPRGTTFKVTRTVYNLLFSEERVAEGEIYFKSSDRVRLQLKPLEVGIGDRGQRLDKSGQPLKLVRDFAQTWIWTDNEVIYANDDLKEFEVIALPPDAPQQSLLFHLGATEMLPFLLEIPLAELQKSWTLELMKNTSQSSILVAKPRSGPAKENYSECWIMINRRSWQTEAVKCFDVSGDFETVFRVWNRRRENAVHRPDDLQTDFKQLGYRRLPFQLNAQIPLPVAVGREEVEAIPSDQVAP